MGKVYKNKTGATDCCIQNQFYNYRDNEDN